MRLAIDAMGNDAGPPPIVEGVRLFLERDDSGATVVLVGREEVLRPVLADAGLEGHERVEIVHATQVMEMHEKVAHLREKRDSSIIRLVGEVKEGRADAMVALGNTAAAIGATCLGLGFLKPLHRAGIAVPVPTREGHPCVVIDMGANTCAKPRHLRDYAVMASVYSRRVLHTGDAPRVGLLNVGEEAGKGNKSLREAYELLQQAPVNFVGNVEGGDIYNGACEVVVCDGFTGNTILKASEELASTVAAWLREAYGASWVTKIGALLSRRAFRILKKRISYAEYGGAPLLGVDGVCIIGHGRSSPDAVYNALRVAGESVHVGLNGLIRSELVTLAAGSPVGSAA
jgi:glycerol-3-phosphate acyltransferase PlsX